MKHTEDTLFINFFHWKVTPHFATHKMKIHLRGSSELLIHEIGIGCYLLLLWKTYSDLFPYEEESCFVFL